MHGVPCRVRAPHLFLAIKPEVVGWHFLAHDVYAWRYGKARLPPRRGETIRICRPCLAAPRPATCNLDEFVDAQQVKDRVEQTHGADVAVSSSKISMARM